MKLRLVRWTPAILFSLGLLVYFSRLLASPPGINADSARAGLYSLDFLYRNVWPFYIYQHFAPTPLLVYLQAPAFLVFGFTLPALRGVTAFANALTVPALYIAGRGLFAGIDPRFAHRAGLIAALGILLFPYWTMFARHGLEGTLLPIFELVAIAALWRGLRRNDMWHFGLAGVMLGLSQYMYILARAFPVAFGLACLAALFTNRLLWSRWRGLGLAALMASLVALPQWLLFITAPYTFSARVGQSAGQLIFDVPDAGNVFVAKLVNQLLLFGWRWETGYNLYSTRPWLTPILFLGFAIAVIWAIRSQQAAPRFALTALLVMLIPDLLTYEGASPSASRLMGAIHLTFLLAGAGCTWLWHWFESQPRLPRFAQYSVLTAVLLFGAEREWDFAFNVIPKVNALPGLEWRASLIEMAEAEFIFQNSDTPILLPTREYTRAPLAFLLADRFPTRHGSPEPPLAPGETVISIVPADVIRPTAEGIPANYVPGEYVLLKDGHVYFLPPMPLSLRRTGEAKPLSAGNGVLAAYAIPAQWFPMDAQPAALTSASFNNGLDLVGYTISGFAPGGTVTMTLYWQPQRALNTDAQVFAQILDRNGNAIASIYEWPLNGAYRAQAWLPGEIVPLSYQVHIPAGLPPGPYQLVAGVWDLIHQRRLELSTGGDIATVAMLKIPLPPLTAEPEQRLSATFGESIRLAGNTLDLTGDGVKLTFYWQAIATPDFDYTVFVHIIDANGNIVAQSDSQPRLGEYPTSIWSAGEVIEDERVIPIAPGEYQVFVGLYRWDTGERLPATIHGQRAADDRIGLGGVKVP